MRKILVMDDERDALFYYRAWMGANAGSDNEDAIEIIACASIPAARQAVAERFSASKEGNGGPRFDLCLLDFKVPGDTSGLDFARELVDLGIRSNNIILITAGEKPNIIDISLQYTPKPINEIELKKILINNGFGVRDVPRKLNL